MLVQAGRLEFKSKSLSNTLHLWSQWSCTWRATSSSHKTKGGWTVENVSFTDVSIFTWWRGWGAWKKWTLVWEWWNEQWLVWRRESTKDSGMLHARRVWGPAFSYTLILAAQGFCCRRGTALVMGTSRPLNRKLSSVSRQKTEGRELYLCLLA